MPTIDLRDPALRERYGLRQESQETVVRPSRWWKQPKQDHRSRAETKALILQVLRSAAEPLSRSQIRRAIDRVDSPYFRDVLAELVALELVVEHELPGSGLLPLFVYEVR